MKNIYFKLFKIQQELKVNKGQYNDFGKYKYRSCEDILEGVKSILNETKTILLLEDSIVVVGGRTYVCAKAKLIDTQSGEQIENSAYAREEESKKGMDGSQVTGASSSYARKYALNGLFAIDDTKDSDSTNQGNDDQKNIKEEIKKFLLYICGGDTTRISNALEFYTSFTGKDGQVVPGIKEIDKLEGKRLQTAYGKIKAEYLKKGGK